MEEDISIQDVTHTIEWLLNNDHTRLGQLLKNVIVNIPIQRVEQSYKEHTGGEYDPLDLTVVSPGSIDSPSKPEESSSHNMAEVSAKFGPIVARKRTGAALSS